MNEIKLKDGLTLRVEKYKARLRLIIAEQEKELVCTKETFLNLKKFIEADQSKAFKGRLQLVKEGIQITVNMKGENVGVIAQDMFVKLIKKANEK